MFEQRSLKLDVTAVGLVALIVFLALSLISYHPADPVSELVYPLSEVYQSDPTVYPVREQVGNACGRLGAIVADAMFSLFGLAAYYVVFSLAAVNALLLMRRKIDTPGLRLAGWMFSLFGLTALLSIVAPSWSPGPVIGSGGYLGAWGRAALAGHFAWLGGVIFAGTLLLAGTLLCTDYALFRLAHIVLTETIRIAGAAWRHVAHVRQRLPHTDRRKEGADDEPAERPLRIRRKKPISAAEETEDGPLDETPDDDIDADAGEEEEALPHVNVKSHHRPPQPSLLAKVRKRLSGGRAAAGEEDAASGQPAKPVASERDRMIEALEAAEEPVEDEYELPEIDLLLRGDDFSFAEQEKEVRRKAKMLERTFANFGLNVRVVEIETGPVIAQYEVELEAGLRLSKVTSLADDLAIALRVPSVRIVAPIPGKNTVGIEVPNQQRQMVRLRDIIEETNGRAEKMRIPLYLGKDVSGNPMVVDLTTLPHLLIAGRTGTGKSVCLNAIISSMLMSRRPDEVRMLLIDPKMVELSCYKTLPHLMHPVVTDMRKAEAILAWAVDKMEERYELLARAGVRHVSSYNQLSEGQLMKRVQPETDEEWDAIPRRLPYIVIVADEMADLMMTAGKEVEQHIIRLAQKSRAVGIHLVLATQKPTVDVITGLIKSNLPARVSFQVASRTDSRVVLDEMGAEKLLGNGDMLFLWPGTSNLLRGQGTYLSDDEIDGLVEACSTGEQNFVKELVQLKVEDNDGEAGAGVFRRNDDLYESAVDIVVREGRGSCSLLQRALGIGYGRAARMIDFMAEDGIVGTYNGSQARDVIISIEDWERMQRGESAGTGDGEAEETAPVRAPKPEPPKQLAETEAGRKQLRRSNKIIPIRGENDEILEDDDFEADGLEEERSPHAAAAELSEDEYVDESEAYQQPDDEEEYEYEYVYVDEDDELDEDAEYEYEYVDVDEEQARAYADEQEWEYVDAGHEEDDEYVEEQWADDEAYEDDVYDDEDAEDQDIDEAADVKVPLIKLRKSPPVKGRRRRRLRTPD